MLISPHAYAQLSYNKLVGIGVDTTGRPWVSGTWDTGSDGVPDRIQMTRYTTSGIENVGFDPLNGSTEVALNIYGGGGVDLSTSGAQDQPWLIFDRDTEPDGTRNDFASRREAICLRPFAQAGSRSSRTISTRSRPRGFS